MKNYFFTTIIFIFLFSSSINAAVPLQNPFEQGLEAFNSGNYVASELIFRKIIDSDSDGYKEKAGFYLACSIFYQKKYESAIFEFNRFLTSCTNLELCSMARYWIAESYYQQNDLIKSIQEFKRFISQSKDIQYISRAYQRIGIAYYNQQRYDEAIIEWTKALDKYEDKAFNDQLRLNIGEAFFLNKNYNEAIEIVKPLMDPKIGARIRSLAVLITGKSYQIQGKNKTALKVFSEIDESLIGEKPYNDVQYFRGISYISLGDLSFAEIHLKSFLSASKDSIWLPDAKYQLANIYLKENKIKEGIELLENVRRNGKSDIKNNALLELSRIYIEDNAEEAIKCLSEIDIDSAKDRKEVLLLSSKAYIKVNNFKEAENILNELLDNYSYDKDVDSFHFLLGRVYLEENNYEGAIIAFDKIKRVNPFSKYIKETNYYLALAHLKNKQSDEAIKLLIQYCELKNAENKYNAYVTLLNLYSEKHDFKNAERIISILKKDYPAEKDMAEILYKYAKTLTENNKQGEKYFNLIINKYNNSQVAGMILLSWGDEAFAKKDYSKAEKYYKQYLSVQWRDNSPSVFLYYIISLERLGNYKEIISILSSDDKIPPLDDFTSKQIKLWLAKSYYETKEYKKALDSYSDWKLIDLSTNDLLIMIKCRIKLDDITTVKRILDLLQTDKNAYAEALIELSLYYINKKDNYNAYTYLYTIIQNYNDSNFVDDAKIEIAELNLKEEKFTDAIQILNEIKNVKLELRKNALYIISFFKSGKESEAIALTTKYLNDIIESPYGEMVIRENVIYYYKINNINNFNKYTTLLKKYPENNTLIDYLSGKLNLQNKNYNTSYRYFSKLAEIKNEYRDEAIYWLGIINLLKNKNSDLALSFFKKFTEDNYPENEFVMKGKINLAILLNEHRDFEFSKKVLFDIINKSENRLYRIQAENLVEYFGYKE